MIVLVIGGSFVLKGMLPIMPVFGTSMEPTLKAGNIVTIDDVSPRDVKVGDIIVFDVPDAVREYYNYPPVVAHRVLEINDNSGFLTFRTGGDNTGEEPFAVRDQDVRGRVGEQIPFLGFPLLFLQSQQGMVFMVVAIIVLGLYLYRGEITNRKKRVQEGVFAPVIEQNERTAQVLEQKVEGTQKALERFSSAMEEYAVHLKSHTSAIQGLSEASHHLKDGAAEQNKVLARLTTILEEEMGSRRHVMDMAHQGEPRRRPAPAEETEDNQDNDEPAPPVEDLLTATAESRKKWATGLDYEDWLG